MTTSLILRPTGELTETDLAMLVEMEAEGDAGFDFTPLRLKFPTGGVTNSFVLSDGETLKAPVKMIVAVAQRSRAYWPSKKTLGKAPLCSAPDGVTGHFDVAAVDQIKIADAAKTGARHPALLASDMETAAGPWECAACPLSQWGSVGDEGRGQACKAMRRLLVVVEGWAMPAVLTLPPTSIKVWDGFASGLKQRGQAYFSRWATVGLESAISVDGTTYAVIKVESGAPLTPGEAAEVLALRAQYAELVRVMDLTPDDYNTDAPTVDADTGEVPPF